MVLTAQSRLLPNCRPQAVTTCCCRQCLPVSPGTSGMTQERSEEYRLLWTSYPRHLGPLMFFFPANVTAKSAKSV